MDEYKSHMEKHHEESGRESPDMFGVEFNNYNSIISTVFKRFYGSDHLANVTLSAGLFVCFTDLPSQEARSSKPITLSSQVSAPSSGRLSLGWRSASLST